MRFSGANNGSRRSPRRAGFSLPELLVTVTIFSMVLAAILVAQVFGLKMSKVTEAKLAASGGARVALGKMADEIRTCTGAWVGNVATNGVFEELLDGVPQVGGALLVQPSTNAADFIIYFVNGSDSSFRRTTSAAGTTTVLARSVTNSAVFRAQDFRGNTLTNSQNNRVFHVDLEFYQAQASLPVSSRYKLETSVTRRATP
ncbi:MAG: type II secretion system protein [Verrucomicrobiota bacterium]